MSRLTKWQRQFMGDVHQMGYNNLLSELAGEFHIANHSSNGGDDWKFDVVMDELRRRLNSVPKVIDYSEFKKTPEGVYEAKRYWFVSGQALVNGHWRPWNGTASSDGMFSVEKVQDGVVARSGCSNSVLTWWKEISFDEYNALS